MWKSFTTGLLSGFGLALLVFRVKLGNHFKGAQQSRRTKMTAEDKVVSSAREVLERKPEAKTPSEEFLRDWAYGNAGLEDERITIEQVETVLSKRSA